MGKAQKIKMAAMTTHLKPHLFFYAVHAMPNKKRAELHVVTPAVLTLPPASVIALAFVVEWGPPKFASLRGSVFIVFIGAIYKCMALSKSCEF